MVQSKRFFVTKNLSEITLRMWGGSTWLGDVLHLGGIAVHAMMSYELMQIMPVKNAI